MHIAFYSVHSSHDYLRRKIYKYNKTVYETFYRIWVGIAIIFGPVCIKCKTTRKNIGNTDLNTGK